MTIDDVIHRLDFLIESEPGIQIWLRQVRSASGLGAPVLLIHGGGPGGIVFDLPIPGYSLAEDLVAAGYTAYCLDVRGWGNSARPQALKEPREHNPPAVTSEEAVRDIGAVVGWISLVHGGEHVGLIGWATGGHWAGMYTARHNKTVQCLVILNSLYGVRAPWPLRAAFERPDRPGVFDYGDGAYRLVDRRGLLASWDRAIPAEDKSEWRDPAVAEAYVRESLASDPTSESRMPPSMRIPRAFQLESYNLSLGHKYWDAAAIRVPTLVIRGDRDHWSRPEDLAALRAELVNAPRVRAVAIEGGTHYLFLDRPERGRARFLAEVLSLLAER